MEPPVSRYEFEKVRDRLALQERLNYGNAELGKVLAKTVKEKASADVVAEIERTQKNILIPQVNQLAGKMEASQPAQSSDRDRPGIADNVERGIDKFWTQPTGRMIIGTLCLCVILVFVALAFIAWNDSVDDVITASTDGAAKVIESARTKTLEVEGTMTLEAEADTDTVTVPSDTLDSPSR